MSSCKICRCPCTTYGVFTEDTYEELKTQDQDPTHYERSQKFYEYYWTHEHCKWCFHAKHEHLTSQMHKI